MVKCSNPTMSQIQEVLLGYSDLDLNTIHKNLDLLSRTQFSTLCSGSEIMLVTWMYVG